MGLWQQDTLAALRGASCEKLMFRSIALAASQLGFDFCAYGLHMPWPAVKPRVFMMNNYPQAWQARYEEAGYLRMDPTVQRGRKGQVPMVWNDELFATAQDLWSEAQGLGLRVGWAQSSLDMNGVLGMLTMCRSHEAFSAAELLEKEGDMRWLVNAAHVAMSPVVTPKLHGSGDVRLTEREVEVLRWTADGRTSSEIAEILAISVDTVNFHIKNAVVKLKASNKTAATVRAAMLGWLN